LRRDENRNAADERAAGIEDLSTYHCRISEPTVNKKPPRRYEPRRYRRRHGGTGDGESTWVHLPTLSRVSRAEPARRGRRRQIAGYCWVLRKSPAIFTNLADVDMNAALNRCRAYGNP
jgi:hypothetical protein